MLGPTLHGRESREERGTKEHIFLAFRESPSILLPLFARAFVLWGFCLVMNSPLASFDAYRRARLTTSPGAWYVGTFMSRAEPE